MNINNNEKKDNETEKEKSIFGGWYKVENDKMKVTKKIQNWIVSLVLIPLALSVNVFVYDLDRFRRETSNCPNFKFSSCVSWKFIVLLFYTTLKGKSFQKRFNGYWFKFYKHQ